MGRKKVKKRQVSLISLFVGILLFFIVSVIQAAQIELPDAAHPIRFYSNQLSDDLTTTFVAAIQEAEKSVDLVMYGLTDSRIIHALNDQAKRGREVYVVFDTDGSPYLSQKLHQAIKKVRRHTQGLTHQKLLVTDRQNVWIGSTNFTKASLRYHSNLVNGIVSPHLATLVSNRIRSYQKDNVLPGEPPCEEHILDHSLQLYFLPNPASVDVIVNLLKTAKKSIKVAMFTWTREDFADAIISAKKRGVKVEVVIDRQSGLGVSSMVVDKLRKAGIAVALSKGTSLMHHKFVWIDQKLLVHGSTNWTKAAFNKNDDVFLVMHPLTSDEQKWMKKLWSVITFESES